MRTWASVIWIVVSPVAGFMYEKYGMKYSIGLYAIGSLLAVPAGWLLPLESLLPKEPTTTTAAAAIIIAPPEAFEEPLLVAKEEEEEFPAAAPLLHREIEVEEHRPALAKALDIVRFIEAITELGAIPPPGSLYGFAEVATPYAAGHFRGSEFEWEKRKIKEGEQGDEEKGEGVEGVREEREREDDQVRSAPFPSVTEPLIVTTQGEPGQLRIQVSPPPPPRPEALSSSAPVALPRGMLSRALSAGDLLRDIRDIQPPQQRSSENDGDGEKKVEKVHGWMPARPDIHGQPKDEKESEINTAGSPSSHRSSALKRLAQIFTRTNGVGASSAGTFVIGEGEDQEASLPASYLSGADSPSSAATQDLLFGFTPVQNYLESRTRRLTPTADDMSIPAATASNGGPSSSTGGPSPHLYLPEEPSLAQIFDGDDYHDISPTPSLSLIEVGGEAEAQPQISTTAAAVLRARISPELMREALDMEAAEIAGMDPTGSLVVDVLSKKLARMAAREKRKHARQHRQWREQQKERQEKHFKFAETTNHHPRYIVGAVPTAFDDSSPLLLPASGTSPAESASSHSIWSRLAILFHDPSILSFFTIATLLGFGHGIIGTFLFMYLKNLGAGEGLMGCVLLANALPELPVFYFFGTILRAVGMDTLLLGSTAVLSLRIAAYSLFNTSTNNNRDCTADLNCSSALNVVFKNESLHIFGFPPLSMQWIYLIETLHAITYAVGWSACTLNASKIAPSGLESTTQAVFQGLWSGIGAGSGGLIGGLLYHWKGPDALFLCSAAAIGVGCVMSGVVLGVQHKKRRY